MIFPGPRVQVGLCLPVSPLNSQGNRNTCLLPKLPFHPFGAAFDLSEKTAFSAQQTKAGSAVGIHQKSPADCCVAFVECVLCAHVFICVRRSPPGPCLCPTVLGASLVILFFDLHRVLSTWPAEAVMTFSRKRCLSQPSGFFAVFSLKSRTCLCLALSRYKSQL